MKVKTKEIKLEEISQIEKRLIVGIDDDYFKEEMEKSYKEVIKGISIKGFRPGKAPRTLVEKLYGEHIKEDVIRRIEKDFIEGYFQENQVDIVSKIRSDHSLIDNALRFEFSFEVKPVIAPSNYRGIEVKGKEISVSEEEIDAAMNDVVEQYSNILPKETDTIDKGDYIRLTIVGHKDPNMKNRPIYLELNEKKTKKFIIDALVGRRLNEVVDLKTAEDSDETMKVRIENIKRVERPTINDEFVKRHFQMDSADALKKDIEQRIRQRRGDEEKESMFDQIIKEIISRNPFPVPPSMVERAIENYLHNIEHSSNRRLSAEERTTISNSVRDNIVFGIQKYLIMEAIGRLEGIDIDDNDLEAQFKKIADATGENVIKVKAYYEKNGLIQNLKEDLRMNKVKDYLIKEAKIAVEK